MSSEIDTLAEMGFPRNRAWVHFSFCPNNLHPTIYNSDLDPDQNYYNQIITQVESCDYHDEDTF